MKDVITFVDGRMLNDTYLLVNDGQALIVDPSFSNEKLKSYVSDNNIKVLAILLTHGHYDHFAGVENLGNLFHCPYYISEEDEDFLYDRTKSFAPTLPKLKPLVYPDGLVRIGDFAIGIIKTPGHTPGSVVLVWENNMFSGDFIFHGDIGRTDLPGSSSKQMQDSLKAFAAIKGEYTIYPGHEESSSLAEEKKNNPYLLRYV